MWSLEYIALHEVPEAPCVPVGLYGRQLFPILAQEYCLAEALHLLGEVPLLQVVDYGQMKYPAFPLKAVVLGYQLTDVLDFNELRMAWVTGFILVLDGAKSRHITKILDKELWLIVD